jgi:hypothetical protein
VSLVETVSERVEREPGFSGYCRDGHQQSLVDEKIWESCIESKEDGGVKPPLQNCGTAFFGGMDETYEMAGILACAVQSSIGDRQEAFPKQKIAG